MKKRLRNIADTRQMEFHHRYTMKCVSLLAFFFCFFFFLSICESTQAEWTTSLQERESEWGGQFVTPEMFGAVGDGKADDAVALQKAVDSGYPVLLSPKEYLTNSTITISGKTSITDTGSTISYTGYDYAIRFTAINNNCDVSFGIIKALNGSGIEFYCSSRQERCQYINLSFNIIEAHDCCIYFNRDGDGNTLQNGWLNEIRISDGRFQAGKYGIYANAKGYNGINNIKFINVAFEGVNVGAHMANGCRGWSFINTRVAEMNKEGQLIFETKGSMIGLIILTTDRFRTERTSFSSNTQGSLIAPIMGSDNYRDTVIGNIGEIINGVLHVYNQSMASLGSFTEITGFADLDTFIWPGNYCCKNNGTAQSLDNSPTDSPFTMVVYLGNGTPDFVTQEVRTADGGLIFTRTYSKKDGSFSEWKRQLNEDDLITLQNEIDALYSYIDKMTDNFQK